MKFILILITFSSFLFLITQGCVDKKTVFRSHNYVKFSSLDSLEFSVIDSFGLKIYLVDSTTAFVKDKGGEKLKPFFMRDSSIVYEYEKLSSSTPVLSSSETVIYDDKVIFTSPYKELYKSFYFEKDSVVFF